MKVLFTFGGMPHYLVEMLNNIHDRGIDVVVIIPEGHSKVVGQAVLQDQTNAKFKIIGTKEIKSYYKLQYLTGLKRIIKNEKPDIFVTNWPYVGGFVFYPDLLFTIKKYKVKLIMREIPFMVAPFNKAFSYYKKFPVYDENLVYEKNYGVKYYLKMLFLTLVRKYYYSIIKGTINYAPKAFEVQPSYGVKAKNIFITNNSPNTDELFFEKSKIDINKLDYNPYRIIHVGRLAKWKRVDILISAFSKVKQQFPMSELLIIGNGPEKENLIKLVNSFNISESITWAGGVYDYPTLGKYLMSSGVYVLAGMGGLSINEAMAFGKPIICSVCDGTEKVLVRDGINGLFFKENDIDDLAQKIIYLFNNPELIGQMGIKSEQIIKEEININSVVDNYINAFEYFNNTSKK